jgi:SAM-dependent methyltransferase
MKASSHYRQLDAEEAAQLSTELADAWKDESIPRKQYESVVKPELARFASGGSVAPFDAFVRCLKALPESLNSPKTTFLDEGASGGYYREVMRHAGFQYDYTGVDFSPAFKVLAWELHPDMVFDVADARHLPYLDGSFDVVMSAAVMMHVPEYERVLAEAVRVSRKYVLLHRTPVFPTKPTAYFVKEAYGVPCIEIHFNADELAGLFQKYGLTCIYSDSVFFDEHDEMGHRNYLLTKDEAFHISA